MEIIFLQEKDVDKVASCSNIFNLLPTYNGKLIFYDLILFFLVLLLSIQEQLTSTKSIFTELGPVVCCLKNSCEFVVK